MITREPDFVPIIVMDPLYLWVWQTTDLRAYLLELAASAYQAGGWWVSWRVA